MSDLISKCQAKWRENAGDPSVRCTRDGVERLVINNHPFSLSGMQMKLQANKFYICDECWPKAKPALLIKMGHPKETVEAACAEAGSKQRKERPTMEITVNLDGYTYTAVIDSDCERIDIARNGIFAGSGTIDSSGAIECDAPLGEHVYEAIELAMAQ